MGRMVSLVMTVATALLVGGATLTMAPGPADATFPGKNGNIAFASNRTTGEGYPPEGNEIFLMRPDGSGLRQITSNNRVYSRLSWSADGSRLAFSRSPYSRQQGGSADIWVKDFRAGGKVTRIASGPRDDGSPSFSPDGSKVVFASDGGRYSYGTPEYDPDIYVVDSDGSGRTRLTDDPEHEVDPVWSPPDGSKIAFTRCEASWENGDADRTSCEIWSMNPDGSGQTNITEGFAFDGAEGPDWSPDGIELAFSDNANSNESDIWKVDADGSDATNLTGTPVTETEKRAPVWSPDGSKIAYIATITRNENGGDYYDGTDVYKMNADGSGQRNLTDTPGVGYSEFAPAWRPMPVPAP